MESLMLTVKFALLYGFEVFVIATMGATVIAGLVQIVQNRVRKSLALTPATAEKS